MGRETSRQVPHGERGQTILLLVGWGEAPIPGGSQASLHPSLYAKSVVQTQAFDQLLSLYRTEGSVTLWDFDGYDHILQGKTLKEVINDPNKTMGHAFVLAYLLEGLVKEVKVECSTRV